MLRWLIAGSGAAGTVHVNALGRIDGACVAGIVASGKPAARRIAGQGTSVYADIEQALVSCAPDAFVIATPNDTHLDLATAALRAGVPVLCEKPVGRTASESEQILELATSLGVPAGVVLNQRFFPHNVWIREQVDAGLKITAMTCRANLPILGGWQSDPARSGGGLLRIIGVHYLDLMRWWLGEPGESDIDVQATMAGEPVESGIQATYSFPCGTRASLDFRSNAEGVPPGVQFDIETDRGSIQVAGNAISCSGMSPPPASTQQSYPDQIFGPGHARLLEAATQALRRDRRFPISLADAIPSLRLVDMTYAAARTGS
jgi:predicted dehydrogenase